MSFQDSSVTPMTSQDSYIEVNDHDDIDDEETVRGIEIGEHLNLIDNAQLISDSQTDGSNVVCQSTGGEEDPLQNAYGKRVREKKSIIHKEMSIVSLPDGSKKWKCKWCGSLFKVDSKYGSTSNAKKHLEKYFNRKMSNEKEPTQTKISGTFGDATSPSVATWQYNHAKVRELAAHMVLGHEFPFMIMEGVIFNRFLKEIYPWYKRITRHTVRTDCESFYKGEKTKMKIVMSKVNRISLTTDLWWSGEQKIGYMTVTSHFIDSKWQLHKRVLAFMNVPPPHSGEVLARELIRVMDDWRIKEKVVSISVDNASANDNCIARLKADFTNKRQLPLNGQLFHVRCFAHILNLLVQDGLDVIKPVVDKIRGGVKYLLNSEARCKHFEKIVKELDLMGRLQVLDTKTRWNSTWLILSTACFYKTVWPRYAEENASFIHYLPNDSDWEMVNDICKLLEVFADITNIISGTSYPTVNLFLSELWRVKVLLDENIQLNSKPHLQTMAMEMKLKYDKYWSQCDILLSIGAFLDPRYKMVFISWVYPYMYGPNCAIRNEALLLNNILSLFKEYEKIHKKENGVQVNSKEGGSSSSSWLGKRSFEMYLDSVEVVDKTKSDLDYYLEDDPLRVRGEGIKFDVLQWWMVNEPKYPILSKLAKDVLSIPVTTVASEATFSAGKRIIDPKRASMKVETVEMLVCGGDWVKELYGIKKGHGRSMLQEEEEEEEHLEYNFANDEI